MSSRSTGASSDLPERQPHVFTEPGVVRKRRRRSPRYAPTSNIVYDWIGLLLLGYGAIAGPFIYGLVTTWSLAPLLACVFLGTAMLALRPLALKVPAFVVLPRGVYFYTAFLLYAFIQVPFALVPYYAMYDAVKALAVLLVFIGITNLLLVRKRGQVLLGLLLLTVSVISWYAIIQYAHGSNEVWFSSRPEVYGQRAGGSYICPNHFAHLVTMMIPFALAMLVIPSKKKLSRVVGGYALLLFTPVLFLTLSRSGWIAGAMGGSMTLLLIAWKKNRRTFYTLLAALPVTAVTGFAALWFLSPDFQDRITGALLSSHDDSVGARLKLWKDTLPMIREALVFGHGGGSYQWVYPRFQSNTLKFWIDYAHNEFLQFLAEYGLVGMALLGGSFVSILTRVLGLFARLPFNRNACLVAALLGSVTATGIHALFDFNLHITANVHVLALLTAIVLASLVTSDLPGGSVLQGKASAATRGLLGLLALAALVIGGGIYLGDAFLRKGEKAREAFRYEQALQAYAAAQTFAPQHHEPYLRAADVHRTQGIFSLGDPAYRQMEMEASFLAYQEAVRRNPVDINSNLGLSLAFLDRGDTEHALERFDRMAQYAHHNFFFLKQAGTQFRKAGDLDKAHELLKQARTIGNDDQVTRQLMAVEKAIRKRDGQ